MATDYDAPRKTDEELNEDSIEELKARRHDKNSGKVDEDEVEAAESFELPGADLSHEELSVQVLPRQEDEFTCSQLLPGPPPQPARRPSKNGVLICQDCAPDRYRLLLRFSCRFSAKPGGRAPVERTQYAGCSTRGVRLDQRGRGAAERGPGERLA